MLEQDWGTLLRLWWKVMGGDKEVLKGGSWQNDGDPDVVLK